MSSRSTATAKSETPVFFQAGNETLFGILTRPATDAADTAVVLLRGGNQGTSAGRNGVSARLCRRLAHEGYYAFRFDYRGVGESTGTVERFRLDRPFGKDLEGAVRCLEDEGIERFALIGQCFGARTALAYASSLPGLEALVLMAAPVRDKEKDETGTSVLVGDRGLWHYVRRGLDPQVIRGLFDRRRRRMYARLAKAAWQGHSVRRRQSPDHDGAIQTYWVSPGFLASLEAVLRRRIPILFLSGTADPGHNDFHRALSGRLGEILREAGSLVDVEVLEGYLGAFADPKLQLQDQVIDLIAAWLARRPQAADGSSKERV